MDIRATTLMGRNGDTTIVWTEEADDQYRDFIEKKMKEGFVFFIIEPRFFGMLPPKRIQVTAGNLEAVMKQRALTFDDTEVFKLLDAGVGQTVPTPSTPVTTVRKTKDAAEAAKHETVGVRPLKGG